MRRVGNLGLLQAYLAGMLVLMLLACSGCGREGETRIIDFKDTVEVTKPNTSGPDRDSLKVAVAAMVSPKEGFVYYRELLDYLGRKLNKGIHLAQRKTYREVNELLGKGSIDIAFICSGPYAAADEKSGFELLVAPEINGSHFYQSYLIVNKSSPYKKLEDLRGKTFAFTDPESNTGRLVPLHWLSATGQQPETFFEKSIFTYSHDNSIMAVAKGLVDGAAVDGLIWEYFNRTKPRLTGRTRVIRKSENYGIPPLVSSSALSPDMKTRITEILLRAHEDPQGRRILDGLKIDRFVEARDEWYNSIRLMLSTVPQIVEQSNDSQKP